MKEKTILNRMMPYLFIAPTIIGVLIFSYIAMGKAVFNSFTDMTWGRNTHFVGLENYINALNSDVYMTSFKNQVIYAVVRVFTSTFFPLMAAELVFFIRHKNVANLVKKLFVLPMLVPGIVNIMIWKYLYNNNYGINNILRNIGLSGVVRDWLNDPNTALLAILFTGFPFISGLYFLIMHTGVNMLGGEMHEAAVIDGASSFQIVRYIHLKNMIPYVKTISTLALIGALGQYGTFAAMTAGGPGYKTVIPALVMYQTAFGDGRFGYASALGVILVFEILILTAILRKVMGKEED